ncbi:MAG: ribonuclease P protein component [Bernardetiaceae bacterium]|nr:ribonuclease P protein component [Bernardetiaceae bacterium]
MALHSFCRHERLKSDKIIQELFKKGSSVFLYPFKIYYLPIAPQPVGFFWPKVLVSVSKRQFKRAVDRNRIKRLVREAYRLHKATVFGEAPSGQWPQTAPGAEPHTWAIGLVYVAKQEEPLPLLAKKLVAGLQALLAGQASQPPGYSKNAKPQARP